MDYEERKVLVNGLDGAAFNLSKPWAKVGYLILLKRFMDKSRYGYLESTIPINSST